MNHAPNRFHLFLARWLPLSNEQMLRLLRAALDLQELVKLQHPLLAARPALAALVEDGLSGVVDALLLLTRYGRIVARVAAATTTGRVRGNLDIRVIGFRFFGDGGRRIRRRRDGRGDGGAGDCALDSGCGRGRFFCDGCGLQFNGGVIDSGVFARCAGWDGEEFVEGEDAGFTTFPSWVGC